MTMKPGYQKRVSDKLLKGKSYFDQEALCKVYNRQITLRINANGSLTCREWKPCSKANPDNMSSEGCVQKYYREGFNKIFDTKGEMK